MTAVILAPSYGHAYDAAMALGIGHDWIYPHERVLLDGVQVSRVVMVAGWSTEEFPQATLDALTARTTADTSVTFWDRDKVEPGSRLGWITTPLGAEPTSLPPVAPRTPPRPRRTPWWVYLLVGGLSGAIGSQIGLWTGWW